MSGEEIDKIFRDGLKDLVAPTTDADWAAFEKSLPSGKGGAYWMIALVILVLLGSGYAAYNYQADWDNQYTERSVKLEKSETNPDIQDSFIDVDLDIEKDGFSSHESKLPDDEATQALGAESGGRVKGSDESSKDSNLVQVSDLAKNPTTEKFKDSAKFSFSESGSLTEPRSSGMSNSYPAKTAEMASMNASGNKGPDSYPMKSAEDASIQSSSSEGPFTLQAMRKEGFQIGPASLMSMKTAQVDMEAENQMLAGSKKEIDKQINKKFWPSIYFKLEENTVLGVTPSIGVAMRRDITSLGSGILFAQVGLGYQRTGRLSWSQERTVVNYGFDKYETKSELRTDNLDMIQIPLLVNYQLGVHHVMAGVEGNFIVDASQIFRENESSSEQGGYLYDSGAPDFSLNFSAAYGYSLTERLRLDLGASFGDRIWEPANEKPVGGFIRLNYFVK